MTDSVADRSADARLTARTAPIPGRSTEGGPVDGMTPEPSRDQLTRREHIALLALLARDPSVSPARRLWASWVAGEMVSAAVVKPADLLKGITGA